MRKIGLSFVISAALFLGARSDFPTEKAKYFWVILLFFSTFFLKVYLGRFVICLLRYLKAIFVFFRSVIRIIQ